jgi:hypothetical protein
MRKYKALEVAVHAAPDKQISLTDPDARSMATSGKDTGMVGYNVQAAVDAKHHLIVAHEVTGAEGIRTSDLCGGAPPLPEAGAASGSARLNSEGTRSQRRLLPPTLCFPPVRPSDLPRRRLRAPLYLGAGRQADRARVGQAMARA